MVEEVAELEMEVLLTLQLPMVRSGHRHRYVFLKVTMPTGCSRCQQL